MLQNLSAGKEATPIANIEQTYIKDSWIQDQDPGSRVPIWGSLSVNIYVCNCQQHPLL